MMEIYFNKQNRAYYFKDNYVCKSCHIDLEAGIIVYEQRKNRVKGISIYCNNCLPQHEIIGDAQGFYLVTKCQVLPPRSTLVIFQPIQYKGFTGDVFSEALKRDGVKIKDNTVYANRSHKQLENNIKERIEELENDTEPQLYLDNIKQAKKEGW